MNGDAGWSFDMQRRPKAGHVQPLSLPAALLGDVLFVLSLITMPAWLPVVIVISLFCDSDAAERQN